MQISKYSLINKLQLIAATIYDADQAKTQKVRIKSTNTDMVLTSEFSASVKVKKEDVNEELGSATVNLYQLFNIVSTADELIDFAIDGDKLVISSFINQETEEYELVASIPLLEPFEVESIGGDELETIVFDQVSLNIIKNEFHNFKSDGGFFITVKDGKRVFKYNERGIESELIVSTMADSTSVDYSKFISFRVLELLLGCDGGLSGNEISIYEDGIMLFNDTVTLVIKTPSRDIDVNVSDKDSMKQLCVFDTQMFVACLDKFVAINKTNSDIKCTLSHNEGLDYLTLTAIGDGDMAIESVVKFGATELEDVFSYDIDPTLLFNIFKTTGVQYVALYITDDNRLAVHYRNALIEKKLAINYSTWSEQ